MRAVIFEIDPVTLQANGQAALIFIEAVSSKFPEKFVSPNVVVVAVVGG